MRAPERTFRRAKELRQTLSRPEAKLWISLSRRRLEGLHFRKQHPIGPYILDFYCSLARLAVEIDGESHGYGDRPERDERRDRWLLERGIVTLRVPARAVLEDADGVLRLIAEVARDRAPSVASRHLPRKRGRTGEDDQLS
jgi:very-short-patch-repair endonuclease